MKERSKMKKVRIVTVLGWVGFLYNFCICILWFALAAETATYLNLAFPAGGFNPLIVRMMVILILPIGLAYLLAAIDQDASRSLLIVVTFAMVLGVLGGLAAIFSGMATSYFHAGVIMDGIFALVGIYAIVVARKQ